jgi:hypothetical protein
MIAESSEKGPRLKLLGFSALFTGLKPGASTEKAKPHQKLKTL